MPSSHLPIQTSILDRFGDVGGFDVFHAGEIGNGAADFQDSTISSRAQAEFVDRGLQQSLCILFHRAVAADFPGAHLGVRVQLGFLEALQLQHARGVDALADDVRAFAGVFRGQLLIAQSRHFDLNVDAVEQRAGDLGAVALDLQRRAGAFLLRIGEKAAWAPLRCLFVIGFLLA